MIYISKITFKSYPFHLRKGGIEKEHKFIMSLFPEVQENNPRNHMNILFRKEENKKGVEFIVQSYDEKPSIENIKSSIKEKTKVEVKEVNRIYQNILENKKFSYKIRINPTYCQKGKRVPISSSEEILKWWSKKSLLNGFSIDPENIDINIENSIKNNNYSVSSVEIRGIATINNKDIVYNAIKNGIGKSKSYGFGMLLIGKYN